MKFILKTLVLFAFFSFPARAQPIGFDYRVNRLTTSFERCEQYAPSIATSFTRTTGRTVISTSCEQIAVRIYDLVIVYDGDTRLNLVTTWDEWAQYQGTYADSSACQAAISDELEAFQTNTDLAPVVAYCYAESEVSDDPHPWVLRVDGFGRPRLRPWVLDRNVYAAPYRALTDISQGVERSAANEGLVRPRALMDFTAGLYRFILRYYAEYEAPLSLVQWTSYASPQDCSQRSAELLSILKDLQVNVLESFCAHREFTGMTDFYLAPMVRGSYGRETLQTAYSTMTSCEADRARIVQAYRDQRRLDVVGAVCSYNEGSIFEPRGHFMLVFWRS